MEAILSNVSLKINEKIFLKDPETSELGQKIISHSVDLIDEIGFEAFTFKKLAAAIESTEASVYRYFESKHRLLLYLFSWYWSWMEYILVFQTANLSSSKRKLEKALDLLTEVISTSSEYSRFDQVKLSRIIIAESSKTYLTKEVDKENGEGMFLPYKKFVARVVDLILEINPSYKYPHMLVTTVIEGVHHERFFADHLPRLTDTLDGEDSVVIFYKELVFKSIQK